MALIQIPIRAQAVYGLSALDAGVRLLPFAMAVPIGSIFGAAIAEKTKMPPIYMCMGGSFIQIVGFALLSISSTGTSESKDQYGYQVIAGFSIGISLACLTVMAPFAVEKRDKGLPSYHPTPGPE